MAHPLAWKSFLEIRRGDAAAALSAAAALETLSREHGMLFWRIRAEGVAGWARGRLHDAAAGATEIRRALAALADQGARLNVAVYHMLLAELEAEAMGADSGLARIDEAVVLAHQSDNLYDLAFAHRIRGDILRKAHPDDPAPAEDAYLAAIAVAREQGARSFGLQAALKLAKLYQSTAADSDEAGHAFQ